MKIISSFSTLINLRSDSTSEVTIFQKVPVPGCVSRTDGNTCTCTLSESGITLSKDFCCPCNTPLCLPGEGNVKIENGKSVKMSELIVGDRVQTGKTSVTMLIVWDIVQTGRGSVIMVYKWL